MKKCPYCAEEIQDEAKICRFCQRDVVTPLPPLPKDAPRVGKRSAAWLLLLPVGFFMAMFGGGLFGPGGVGFALMWAGLALALPGPATGRWGGGGLFAMMLWFVAGVIGSMPSTATRSTQGSTPAPSTSTRGVESGAPPDGPAVPRSVLPTTPPVPVSKWTGGSTGRSDMDDSETVAFHLDAENEISGWLKKTRPSLILRCREKRTDAYVTTGMAAQPEYGKMDEATVRVRFDDEQAGNQVWSESTDNEALFAPRAITFIKRVAKAKALRVQFTPFNSSPAIIEFNVSGFGDRIDLLAKTCKWPK